MRCGIDRIEGEEYLGATGLHLAIAYGNDEIASIIIEAKGLNINERALGTFFLPRDQGRHSVLLLHSWVISSLCCHDCKSDSPYYDTIE